MGQSGRSRSGAGLVLERADLDLARAGLRALGGPLQRGVEVGQLDDPEAAEPLLGLGERAVGDDRARRRCCRRSSTASIGSRPPANTQTPASRTFLLNAVRRPRRSAASPPGRALGSSTVPCTASMYWVISVSSCGRGAARVAALILSTNAGRAIRQPSRNAFRLPTRCGPRVGSWSPLRLSSATPCSAPRTRPGWPRSTAQLLGWVYRDEDHASDDTWVVIKPPDGGARAVVPARGPSTSRPTWPTGRGTQQMQAPPRHRRARPRGRGGPGRGPGRPPGRVPAAGRRAGHARPGRAPVLPVRARWLTDVLHPSARGRRAVSAAGRRTSVAHEALVGVPAEARARRAAPHRAVSWVT